MDPSHDVAADTRRSEREALQAVLPSTREFLAELRSRYEQGARSRSPLPTVEGLWESNYERSFWRPGHEEFVHGVR